MSPTDPSEGKERNQMSAAIEELRLVALSPAAHRTVCGLVQPTEEIDPAEIYADDQVWEEIRSIFPAEEACLDEEGPGVPGGSPAPETTQIVVLNDGETFSALQGARIYEVPAGWETEEIEAALAEGLSEPGEPGE
jgi:hypothetical protein